MSCIINKGDTVLFQGDSITDCGRSREDDSNLGGGYAAIAAAQFGMMYPELDVTFLNRGIGGNRVADLRGRWKEDCIDLKPDVVSIMIGINDTWRRFDNDDPTSTETYTEDYHYILTEIKEKLDAKIVLIEPFVLPVPEDRKDWRVDLDPRIHAVRELSLEFNATLIPADGIFAAAAARKNPAYWAADGVHPSKPGHALMAEAWLEAVNAV